MKQVKIFLLLMLGFGIASAQESPFAKRTAALEKLAATKSADEKLTVWVYFPERPAMLSPADREAALRTLSPRAIVRRAKMVKAGTLPDLVESADVPLNAAYLQTLRDVGFEVRNEVKWFNAVSGYATKAVLQKLETLPCVAKLDAVKGYQKQTDEKNIERSDAKPLRLQQQSVKPSGINGTQSLDYGQSLTQVAQINVPAVHNLGNYGQGVLIASFDAGFSNLAHQSLTPLAGRIVTTYDFVNHRTYVGNGQGGIGDGSHGTETLSTIGGFKSGQLIGPAFGASYCLFKTENTTSETPIEEDNWAAAALESDSLGVDVITSSLGYTTFDAPYTSYTWQDMNGHTAISTLAAARAARVGIVVCNSAGNDGNNSTPNTLIAPADADTILTAGAVNNSGVRPSFSSFGPTSDGRIKPDVMAMGVSVRVASPLDTTVYTSSSGTSFSCPLTAGVAALVLSAHPNLTPMQVRQAMRATASQANSPDNFYGWGILNALAAVNYFALSTSSDNRQPTGFGLMQNYPNPFNPTTTIAYTLPVKSNVSLKVYDILGREVATLVSEPQQAGQHNVLFEATRLANGTYLYKLVASATGGAGSNFVQVKKMMLVK
jgi:serine protease AprX